MERNIRPSICYKRTLIEIEVTASDPLQYLSKNGHFSVILLNKSKEFGYWPLLMKGRDLNFNQSLYITYTRPNVSFHSKKSGLGLNEASEEPQNQVKEEHDKGPLVRPS